jgi:hypothetical protein
MNHLTDQMRIVLQNVVACNLGAQSVLDLARDNPAGYNVDGLKELLKDTDEVIELMGRATLLLLKHRD